jgi:hypothetical protein
LLRSGAWHESIICLSKTDRDHRTFRYARFDIVKNSVIGTAKKVLEWGTWNDRRPTTKDIDELADSIKTAREILRPDSAMPVFLRANWLDDPHGYVKELHPSLVEEDLRELQLSSDGVAALEQRRYFMIDQGNHRRTAAGQLINQAKEDIKKLQKLKDSVNKSSTKEDSAADLKKSARLQEIDREIEELEDWIKTAGIFVIQIINQGKILPLHHSDIMLISYSFDKNILML